MVMIVENIPWNNFVRNVTFDEKKSKNNFPFGVDRSVSVLFNFFIDVMQNVIFFSWPRWPIDLKLLQVCQFMFKVDCIKKLHCQQLLW